MTKTHPTRVTAQEMLCHLPIGNYALLHNNIELGTVTAAGTDSDTGQITELLRGITCDGRGTITFRMIQEDC